MIHTLDCTCEPCLTNGLCETCSEQPAAGEHANPWLCAECYAKWLDNYSGPDEPDYSGVSITELSERAYRERRELRRLD